MATTNDRILLGTRKGLFDVRKRNGAWVLGEPSASGQPIAFATRDPRSGTVWASVDHGHWGSKMVRSTDEGKSFEDCPQPVYPEGSDATVKYYWVVQPANENKPGVIWIGTEPGGLFMSEDNGDSWQLNESLWAMCVEQKWQGGGRPGAGIHSICFDPRDPNHAYVAISCAGVLETKDGGKSWCHVNKGMRKEFDPSDEVDFGHDPHCVVMSPSSPDVLWQANHCGVYVSENGAASWKDLTDKPWIDFGFVSTVHPRDPKTAWIVPMRSDGDRTAMDAVLTVARTKDGGASWDFLRKGFPKPAWDFPYRHGMDVGSDGDTLAMGTTSGNFYVSEDGGDSWQCVSSNLPLIYSVRFA